MLRLSLIMLVCTLVSPLRVEGQETSDHQAIRTLLDQDQRAWSSGDVETVLKNRTSDYMVAGIPLNNGEPDFLGVMFGRGFDEMKETLTSPDWKPPTMNEDLETQLSYEMARVNVKGDHAVAISRIEWSQIDTTLDKRVHMGWNSLWFLVKTEDGWKFKSAVAGIDQWERQTNQ